ncbi:MAG: hypothetical protein K0B01_03810 [Syntrophobacterales bacterium]|nr:hypothetical protein [Syntrophobacterales bacterium]
MEQMPLFLDEFVLLNDAANAFNELRLDEAQVLLTDYRNLYPASREDVEEKLRIVRFLQGQLSLLPSAGPELPGLLFQLWRSFELFCGALAYNARMPEKLRRRFFRLIAAAVEEASLPDDFQLAGDIPVGYIYIQTGEYERAIHSLQTCLLSIRESAPLFGYLGDAWWERGNRETARQLYFEACLIAPCAIDWQHLRDEELKQLLQLLPEEYGWPPALACEWLPACAYIRGIFKPKMIRILDELSAFTERYRELQKAFRRSSEPVIAARIFTKGIVLCDNEPFLRSVSGINFIEIRREMKSTAPDLFAEYMKALEKRRRI